MHEKTCTVCSETKPLTAFYRSVLGAGGVGSRCRKCAAAYVRSKYVPRMRQEVTAACPQCGREFTYQPTTGALRVYCSRKCTAAHGDELKRQRNEGLGPRRCACGAEVSTPVGKPVCPDCRKDPRPGAQVRERTRTLRLYGLTQADWDALVRKQKDRCAICQTSRPGGRGERWHIDHDHVTGQVRGLLCHRCNMGVGFFLDDPEILAAAARYVAKHRQMELLPGKAD